MPDDVPPSDAALQAVNAWAQAHDVPSGAVDELRTMVSGWVAAAPPSAAWLSMAAPTAVAFEVPTEGLQLAERLGLGGMGEVRRAHDPRLGRDVAVKALAPAHAHSAAYRSRFVQEARAQAQLAHPGVIPVHDLGTLPDGRPYFTMAVNRGATLRVVLDQLHADAPEWTLRRVVDVLRRASEVVAYAHSQGRLHRDLKPANIMVGAFGEVQVIDWGLVRDTQGRSAAEVAGTPAYMAPEQARGEAVGPATDVFALGAMVFEAAAGVRLIGGSEVVATLRLAARGTYTPMPPDLPEDLATLVRRAIHPDPGSRFAEASELANALSDWLDGAARRARALQVLARAEALAPTAQQLRTDAAAHEARAADLALKTPPSAPVADKQPLWRAQDQAERCRRDADRAERDRVDLLVQALSHDPDLPEARRALAAWYRLAVERAENAGDVAASEAAEARLRHHDRGEHAAFLRGDGAVTLCTQPEGAEVRLHRFALQDRRLVPQFERILGRTPLHACPLPRGSWLLTLHLEGHEPVAYPVHIGRLEHWHGVPPEATAPLPVWMPPQGSLGPDDVYVPAGWFTFGAHRVPHQAWPETRRWLAPLVVRRFPVTNAEYMAFLDALAIQGREDEVQAYVPRARRAQQDDRIDPVYARNPDGTHRLVPDGDGDLWDPAWPVIQIDWRAATAFAAWTASQTRLPWRLPEEDEWEKAGRGVDGRAFPWGDRFDATFALVRNSFPDRPNLAPVTSFAHDESVYGVRWMAGGVREWCRCRFAPAGAVPPPYEAPGDRLLRGGCWHFASTSARLTARARQSERRVSDLTGFRLVRAIDPLPEEIP